MKEEKKSTRKPLRNMKTIGKRQPTSASQHISKEKKEIARAYKKFNKLMAIENKKYPKQNPSPTMTKSKRLFDPEDEPDDWY